MLLKSFKRRVPRATAIVLQFNNIKRELSARGWKRGTGRTTPPPRDPSPHVGDRRNEPRPANPLIPFIFLLSTITPFIFLSGSSRRRFREGTTNDEFRSFRQFKFVWLLSYLIVQCSPRLLYPSSISLLFFSSLRINRGGTHLSRFRTLYGIKEWFTEESIKEWGYFTLGKTQFIGQIHPCVRAQ